MGKFSEGDIVTTEPGIFLDADGLQTDDENRSVEDLDDPLTGVISATDLATLQGEMVGVKLEDGSEIFVNEESLDG